jgi:NTE family protein
LELPINGRRLELPSGIVEGHAMTALLQRLTFRVADVRDFDQFKIPFRCIGGDIVNGKPLVLRSGNLAFALRATMSIPTIFAPIELDGNLLVDGGLFKNFPVDILCDMGAEYVIGGFTGGKLYKKEELNSIMRIIYQSASFSRVAESVWQKQACDILADFNEALNAEGLDGGDFKKTKEILAIGDRVTQKIMPQLRALAAAQHAAQANAAPKPRFPGHLIPDTAVVRVDKRLLPSAEEARSIVDQYYGTLRFKNVNYDLVQVQDGVQVLKINTQSQPKALLNAGLHYDNILSASILANVTLRDMLGANSRATLGVDIGDNYKVRADYRKHLKKTQWWINTYAYFERVKAPVYLNGLIYDEFMRNFFRTGLGIHRSVTRSSQFGLDFVTENTLYRPTVLASQRSTTIVEGDTILGVTQVHFVVPGLEFQYQMNTLDHPVLPTHGTRISARLRFCTGTSLNFGTEIVVNNKRVRQIDRDEQVRPYGKLLLRWESLFKMSENIRFYPKVALGARLTNLNQETQLDVTDRFLVGGNDERNDWAYVPFAGNREGYTLQSAFTTVQLCFPILLPNNFQLIPQYGWLSGTGLNNDQKTPLLDIFKEIHQSFGITAGLQTIIGPLFLNVSKATNDHRWQVYGSIGFRF